MQRPESKPAAVVATNTAIVVGSMLNQLIKARNTALSSVVRMPR
jgi:hypothetical protein